MNEDLSKSAFIQFINNYTQGLLERTLRSERLKNQSSIVKMNNKCLKSTKKRLQGNEICVIELTTETFLDTVLNPKKVSLTLWIKNC